MEPVLSLQTKQYKNSNGYSRMNNNSKLEECNEGNTFSTMNEIFEYHEQKRSPSNPHKVMKKLIHMQSTQGRVSEALITTFLKQCEETNLARSLRYFRVLQRKSITFNTAHYNFLINAFGKRGMMQGTIWKPLWWSWKACCNFLMNWSLLDCIPTLLLTIFSWNHLVRFVVPSKSSPYRTNRQHRHNAKILDRYEERIVRTCINKRLCCSYRCFGQTRFCYLIEKSHYKALCKQWKKSFMKWHEKKYRMISMYSTLRCTVLSSTT